MAPFLLALEISKMLDRLVAKAGDGEADKEAAVGFLFSLSLLFPPPSCGVLGLVRELRDSRIDPNPLTWLSICANRPMASEVRGRISSRGWAGAEGRLGAGVEG